MDSRKSTPVRPEANKDWVERLQWLGIKVEKPGDAKDKDTSGI